MGQIKNIKHSEETGGCSIRIDLELEADTSELGRILATIRGRDCIDAQRLRGEVDEAGEVCWVPLSDLEGQAEPSGVEGWRAELHRSVQELGDQRKRWDVQEAALGVRTAHLDDALGAARIMADALGIENSDRSHVAKLIKQCLGHVEGRRDEFNLMTNEMANMARALKRFGFTPPDPIEDEPMHQFCQRLAHHLDTAKLEGWLLGQKVESDSVSEGRAVVHLSDEQRLAKINALQNEMGNLMADGAKAAGFLKEGMSKEEGLKSMQKWSIYVDNKRRVDQELARLAKESPPEVEPQPAPTTDAEKLAARTKPVDSKVTVKVELESEGVAQKRIEADRAATVEVLTSAG